jgi:hypothetical protein
MPWALAASWESDSFDEDDLPPICSQRQPAGGFAADAAGMGEAHGTAPALQNGSSRGRRAREQEWQAMQQKHGQQQQQAQQQQQGQLQVMQQHVNQQSLQQAQQQQWQWEQQEAVALEQGLMGRHPAELLLLLPPLRLDAPDVLQADHSAGSGESSLPAGFAAAQAAGGAEAVHSMSAYNGSPAHGSWQQAAPSTAAVASVLSGQ